MNNYKLVSILRNSIENQNFKRIHELIRENETSEEEIANLILASGNPQYIWLVACALSNSTIKDKLADAIIEIGDLEYIFKFAAYVKNAPLKKLTTAILIAKDYHYMFLLANYVQAMDSECFYLISKELLKGNTNNIYLVDLVKIANDDLFAKIICMFNRAKKYNEIITIIKFLKMQIEYLRSAPVSYEEENEKTIENLISKMHLALDFLPMDGHKRFIKKMNKWLDSFALEGLTELAAVKRSRLKF